MRKKLLLLLGVLAVVFSYAQHICGFSNRQKNLEAQYPEMKTARLNAERNLQAVKNAMYAKKMNSTSVTGRYTGEIYNIPIVIHVIESATASHNVTDEQIRTWVENTNAIYATTYGNGFYTEGNGADGGTVIPFRLALAQRTPQCTATTGIVRYNGDSIAGYSGNGVNSDNDNGASEAQIRELAPHWPESSYFNIYIVNGFDSNFSNSGLMGWAGYPTNSDAYYESFMKVGAVRNRHDTTLAHEFGHAMGLDHPFGDADSQGDVCPANDNCTTDNDKVCDTEPTQSLLLVYPTPDNNTVNPCTGENYQGVQYNIMNYTNDERKFTPGQRERALAMFMSNRRSLTTSLGATPIDGSAVAAPRAASCAPQAINISRDYGMGPTNVTLNGLNMSSGGYVTWDPQFYIDYTSQACFNPSSTAVIQANTETEVSVSITLNPQFIKVWIDYNNDGVFSDSEIVAATTARQSNDTPFVAKFTAPESAVKNTPIRMRVRADFTNFTNSCANLEYGQVEDYSVTITDVLSTTDFVAKENDVKIAYNQSLNTIILVGKEKFGNYQIVDITGKTIQKGHTNSKEITIKQTLPKGVYIVQFEDVVRKFMVQ